MSIVEKAREKHRKNNSSRNIFILVFFIVISSLLITLASCSGEEDQQSNRRPTEDQIHDYVAKKLKEGGMAQDKHLEQEKDFYVIAGTAIYLTNDFTGEKHYEWRKTASVITHWWDALHPFAGYESLSEFKPMIEALEAKGIPADSIEMFENHYAIQRIMDSIERPIDDSWGSLGRLLPCSEALGWRNFDMLWFVSMIGCLDCVKYLVEEKGLNPDRVNCDGRTPATRAIVNGHFNIAYYLVPKMSSPVKNVRMWFNWKGRTMWDFAANFDFEDKVDSFTSKARLRKFLVKNGSYPSAVVSNSQACFARTIPLADKYRDELGLGFVWEPQMNDLTILEDQPGISSCLYLLAQYESYCKELDTDCEKQKPLATYIEERGYSLDNWDVEKTYFHLAENTRTGTSMMEVTGAESLKIAMSKINGKLDCEPDLSDCPKKLQRKRSNWESLGRQN